MMLHIYILFFVVLNIVIKTMGLRV